MCVHSTVSACVVVVSFAVVARLRSLPVAVSASGASSRIWRSERSEYLWVASGDSCSPPFLILPWVNVCWHLCACNYRCVGHIGVSVILVSSSATPMDVLCTLIFDGSRLCACAKFACAVEIVLVLEQAAALRTLLRSLTSIMVAARCAGIRCRERSPERSDTDVWVHCCSFPFGLERARLVAQAN